jgi:hypothetical protein
MTVESSKAGLLGVEGRPPVARAGVSERGLDLEVGDRPLQVGNDVARAADRLEVLLGATVFGDLSVDHRAEQVAVGLVERALVDEDVLERTRPGDRTGERRGDQGVAGDEARLAVDSPASRSRRARGA